MDYTKTFEPLMKPAQKQTTATPENTKIWVNKACPKCKSSEGLSVTNDGGSVFQCICGNSYKRFIWSKAQK